MIIKMSEILDGINEGGAERPAEDKAEMDAIDRKIDGDDRFSNIERDAKRYEDPNESRIIKLGDLLDEAVPDWLTPTGDADAGPGVKAPEPPKKPAPKKEELDLTKSDPDDQPNAKDNDEDGYDPEDGPDNWKDFNEGYGPKIGLVAMKAAGDLGIGPAQPMGGSAGRNEEVELDEREVSSDEFWASAQGQPPEKKVTAKSKEDRDDGSREREQLNRDASNSAYLASR